MVDPAHKAYVMGWKQAGIALQILRREEIRATDTPSALAALADAFNDGTRRYPPRATSGLIEQQRLFKILAAKLQSQ